MGYRKRMYKNIKVFQQKTVQKNLPLKPQEHKKQYREFRRRQG